MQIKICRSHSKKTQQQLARGIGVTRQLISAYEAGSTGIVVSRVFAIADFLNLPVDYLLFPDKGHPP